MVKRIAIEEARTRLSSVVDGACDEPVLLTRRGRAVAAIVTVEQYELLERMRRTSARSGAPPAEEAPRHAPLNARIPP
ncbi:type II toxin-antitoxin system Phd/YefM family antitoxin [Microbacterium proteolyticum]|uniref:type II toxin-antitoxin system Phd/YefM family antitoxin n=1 Tax=Microbacterium TaxID=33882 RepID=UPI00358F79AA